MQNGGSADGCTPVVRHEPDVVEPAEIAQPPASREPDEFDFRLNDVHEPRLDIVENEFICRKRFAAGYGDCRLLSQPCVADQVVSGQRFLPPQQIPGLEATALSVLSAVTSSNPRYCE